MLRTQCHLTLRVACNLSQRKISVGEMDDNGNNGNDGKVDENKNDKGMFHFPPPLLDLMQFSPPGLR